MSARCVDWKRYMFQGNKNDTPRQQVNGLPRIPRARKLADELLDLGEETKDSAEAGKSEADRAGEGGARYETSAERRRSGVASSSSPRSGPCSGAVERENSAAASASSRKSPQSPRGAPRLPTSASSCRRERERREAAGNASSRHGFTPPEAREAKGDGRQRDVEARRPAGSSRSTLTSFFAKRGSAEAEKASGAVAGKPERGSGSEGRGTEEEAREGAENAKSREEGERGDPCTAPSPGDTPCRPAELSSSSPSKAAASSGGGAKEWSANSSPEDEAHAKPGLWLTSRHPRLYGASSREDAPAVRREKEGSAAVPALASGAVGDDRRREREDGTKEARERKKAKTDPALESSPAFKEGRRGTLRPEGSEASRVPSLGEASSPLSAKKVRGKRRRLIRVHSPQSSDDDAPSRSSGAGSAPKREAEKASSPEQASCQEAATRSGVSVEDSLESAASESEESSDEEDALEALHECLQESAEMTARLVNALGGRDAAGRADISAKIGRGRCNADQSFALPADLDRHTMSAVERLKAYQRCGVHWLVTLHEANRNGILADEMGLGKTAQTCVFLNYLYQSGRLTSPTIIAAPASLLDNWMKELEVWAPFLAPDRVMKYHGKQTERREMAFQFLDAMESDEKILVMVTSLNTLTSKWDMQYLKQIRPLSYLVVDEAHSLKNKESLVYKKLNKVLKCDRRLLLTGSPIQNRTAELRNLLLFLMPAVFEGDSLDLALKAFYRQTRREKAAEHKRQRRLAAAKAESELDGSASGGAEAKTGAAEGEGTSAAAVCKTASAASAEAGGGAAGEGAGAISESSACAASLSPAAASQKSSSLLEVLTSGGFKPTSVQSALASGGDKASTGKAASSRGEKEDGDAAAASQQSAEVECLQRLLSPFILRRLKNEVLGCLPKKKNVVLRCEMLDRQRELYIQEIQTWQSELTRSLEKLTSELTGSSSSTTPCTADPTATAEASVASGGDRETFATAAAGASSEPPEGAAAAACGGAREESASSADQDKPENERAPGADAAVSAEEAAAFAEKGSAEAALAAPAKEEAQAPAAEAAQATETASELEREASATDKKSASEKTDAEKASNEKKEAEKPSVAGGDDATTAATEEGASAPAETADAGAKGPAATLASRKKFVNSLLARLRRICNHPVLMQGAYTDEQLEEVVHHFWLRVDGFKGNPREKVDVEIRKWSDFEIHQAIQQQIFQGDTRLEHLLLSKERLIDSAKMRKMIEIVSELKKKGEKALVFSQYTTYLDVVEACLSEFCPEIRKCRLDGSTAVEERQSLVDDFNADPDLTLFLLSTKAGGQGLNLTAARTVILMDQDWNPQNDRQAEDRVHRLGQTRDVTIYRLCCRGTVEESILKCCQAKLDLDVAFGGNSDLLQAAILQDSLSVLPGGESETEVTEARS
ncbi:SWI2/SNF2-containing protein [Besnoitia besnoiti]|uniref:SWI2/SNF2-containing protein n=1 Tax=Besnoitia besnoiti TaxID=94643 RepID=A0A2A9M9X7_BESBE|nr:SWI2/SNF2-containing protein [Besnoitia besnoiti]PFH33121.1 SWI2/SNF2-containing protein [Besnoitia besnoiti]